MTTSLKAKKLNIKNMIHVVREKQIILDYDLGELYEVETKRINEAVKRNPMKFPKEYCFQLTDIESQSFLVANCDQKKETRGGRYKNPTAFTEYGVTMLATILKSKKAIETSINIVNEFVDMKKMILKNEDIYKQLFVIENKLLDHDEDIKLLKETFEKIEEKKIKNEIYFNGQIYDAYSKIIDILNTSKKEIIIIDSYADKKILDIIKEINRKVIIITKENNLLKKEIINKYKKQYNNLEVYFDNTFHDRFIMIDKKELYHLGTSLNHLGEKTFAINQIQEESFKKDLLKRIRIIM